MPRDDSPAITPEQRAAARHTVYERLALLSTVIWIAVTLPLFFTFVDMETARPGPTIVKIMSFALIPAALPWLFYGKISDIVARRRAARV